MSVLCCNDVFLSQSTPHLNKRDSNYTACGFQTSTHTATTGIENKVSCFLSRHSVLVFKSVFTVSITKTLVKQCADISGIQNTSKQYFFYLLLDTYSVLHSTDMQDDKRISET